jgi:hypothetical protein
MNLRFLVFAALAVAMSACRASAPTAPVGGDFTLGVGEHVSIARTPLILTFTRLVGDSRCPPDVTCVWAGNAELELDARINDQHTVVRLNTNVGPREAIAGDYRITLVEFTPPPASNVNVAETHYRATLVVSSASGGACTEEARAGITLTIVDSLLGSIPLSNVVATVQDGEYADSAVVAAYPDGTFDGLVPFAWERAGTYDVSARAAGYVPWTRAGVVVERDACHVVTVPLTARLAR